MLYDRVASNVRRTVALMVLFTALVAAVGLAAGLLLGIGYWGIVIALGISVAMTWGSYYNSDQIALSMSRAKPADETKDARLHNIVEGLSLAAGLPKPGVYVVDDEAPNAFATGRNPEHAAVAVTTGLMKKLSRDELEGVIAHELAHVKNRDTLVMTISVTLIGTVVLAADFMFRAFLWGGMGRRGRSSGGSNPVGLVLMLVAVGLLVLSPLIARLLHFAISRRREYLADADAVLLTRYPDGLIGALEKLKSDRTVVRSASRATAHLWIESPIDNVASSRRQKPRAWLNGLFNTHPPLDDRIAALRGITGGAGLGSAAGRVGS